MAKAARLSLEEIAEYFGELEDPRSSINLLHPLISVVMIALMATLAGASGPTAIAMWAEIKRDLLLKCLNLPNGIPRKDVFRRVLAALKPEVFQACFEKWIESLRAATGTEQPVVAIDGKTLRRSHDASKGLGPLHVVSAWATEMGLALGQVATDQHSNEITAIPELLKLIDLEGTIITIDAMGTQTAIAKQIVEGKADYVLAVKGNQDGLHKTMIAYIDRQMESNFRNCDACRHVVTETSHGRDETRQYIQMSVPEDFPEQTRWAGLKTLGLVIRTSICKGKESTESRYYISSLPVSVKRFAHAVRSHWRIENTCHWCLDVTFREDDSRIREKHLRQSHAWLNRFTLSLLQQHPSKQSIAMKRRSCGWNDNFLLEVLGGKTT
jgi:predicted transposase YbfD/YdcC